MVGLLGSLEILRGCLAGASANGSEAFTKQEEEDEEDAAGSIAAVVERSLQRAVKSKAHGEPLMNLFGLPARNVWGLGATSRPVGH